jgi:hypothetical protein
LLWFSSLVFNWGLYGDGAGGGGGARGGGGRGGSRSDATLSQRDGRKYLERAGGGTRWAKRLARAILRR